MSARVSQSASRPRKHKKTFTGCWTCRARKVKCDEGRPSCRQCSQRNITCGGYAVRLHWLTPGSGLEDNPQQLNEAPYQCTSQRSRIICNPSVPYEVDDILVAIDASKPSYAQQKSRHNDFSKFIRGFGVFESQSSGHVGDQFESSPVDQAPIREEETTTSISPCAAEYLDVGSTPPGIPPMDVSIEPLYDPLVMDGPRTIRKPSISEPSMKPIDRLSLGRAEESDQDQFHLPEPIHFPDTSESHDTNSVDCQVDLSYTVPRSVSPEYLPRDERLLMNYYRNRVIHFFAVLDSPKSPWKTVHLPRVLQSSGEMALQGFTSQIRAALRNSILSISAFHMSKHVRVESGIEASWKWSRDAMRFHGTAMKLLKDAVNAGSTSYERPKYKELLATMLSMISINVMSGDTASCGLHLDAAERLITEIGKWKSQYSKKAKALHRVYFYLRTIHESTATRDYANSTGAREPTGAVSPLRPESVIQGESFVPSQLTAFHEADQELYQGIYAIPQSLLILLNEATQLVNETAAARQISGSLEIPSPLADRCDELENRIMDWKANSATSDDLSNSAANPGIIRHMTQAFHQAIIIYFAQHIRLLGHRYLRPFVESVLSNIEVVEKIKVERQILASPLYWPAFIAASEAFDSNLQCRFNSWYAQVECYAIGSMDSGIHLLKQVWAEGPSNGSGGTCLWRQIATRTKTTLMLT
ncbi:fungal-specific transcription factor domain-containing protein [Aspergillus ambiguus]|uniref:Zn(II)2Cys6 transcription factor n=1 Tax=Aspergillus ambiguus TaxID=176160 RepID=UPI003CCD76AB